MTYLIALIIAIALGAVIALLSFTNIGSGFSGQSDKAQLQLFAGAASQLEIAVAAFDSTHGNPVTELTGESVNFEEVLQTAKWLRTDLQVPSFATSDYSLTADGDNLDLNLSVENCADINLDGYTNITCADETLSVRVY